MSGLRLLFQHGRRCETSFAGTRPALRLSTEHQQTKMAHRIERKIMSRGLRKKKKKKKRQETRRRGKRVSREEHFDRCYCGRGRQGTRADSTHLLWTARGSVS